MANIYSENYDTWGSLVESILNYTDEKKHPRFAISYDDNILCETERDANIIADFLEATLFDVIHTRRLDEPDGRWKWEVYPD